MLTTVKLYGHLGREFGRVHQFEIDDPWEIIAALRANFKGFRRHLIEHSEPGYRVLINGQPQTLEMLQSLRGLPASQGSGPPVVRIVPVVQGAGDGKAVGSIIAGAALIAVGAFTGFGPAIAVGVALTSAGVSSLLAPMPSPRQVAEREAGTKRKPSDFFTSLGPTSTEGIPIPIHYGRVMVPGYPISVRLTVVNETTAG